MTLRRRPYSLGLFRHPDKGILGGYSDPEIYSPGQTRNGDIMLWGEPSSGGKGRVIVKRGPRTPRKRALPNIMQVGTPFNVFLGCLSLGSITQRPLPPLAPGRNSKINLTSRIFLFPLITAWWKAEGEKTTPTRSLSRSFVPIQSRTMTFIHWNSRN